MDKQEGTENTKLSKRQRMQPWSISGSLHFKTKQDRTCSFFYNSDYVTGAVLVGCLSYFLVPSFRNIVDNQPIASVLFNGGLWTYIGVNVYDMITGKFKKFPKP